ncbi:MAG: SGNH/GDSL hydrolase family protein [Verrucomicrobiota bacterium]
MIRVFFGLLLGFCVAACSEKTEQERWLFMGDSITQAGFYVDHVETWLLLNEESPPEVIDLGLSSETISGLSEPGHPFPRPYAHSRLDDVLERVKPDVVFACYGMNCGIYHPFSDERFAAYQTGVLELIEKSRRVGAEVVLLTPPPFAGRVKPKDPPLEGEDFGYKRPAADYDEVLRRYGKWILSLSAREGVRSINIREGLDRFMEECYPKEPVHPSPYGHELMGEALLLGLGKISESQMLETGVNTRKEEAHWNALMELVRLEREVYDRSLLNDIGHGNPGVMKRFGQPMEEAERQRAEVAAKIEALLLERN